jgi:hypothetical protein
MVQRKRAIFDDGSAARVELHSLNMGTTQSIFGGASPHYFGRFIVNRVPSIAVLKKRKRLQWSTCDQIQEKEDIIESPWIALVVGAEQKEGECLTKRRNIIHHVTQHPLSRHQLQGKQGVLCSAPTPPHRDRAIFHISLFSSPTEIWSLPHPNLFTKALPPKAALFQVLVGFTTAVIVAASNPQIVLTKPSKMMCLP